MPERMSKERLTLLRYLGAQVVLTPGALMGEAVDEGRGECGRDPGRRGARPVRNPANPEAHRETTAREIWEDTAGEIDVFVAGVGTGRHDHRRRRGAEGAQAGRPRDRGRAGAPRCSLAAAPRNHMIQGIGAGFVPPS